MKTETADVKSESWLDLSSIVADPRGRLRRADSEVPRSKIGNANEASKRDKTARWQQKQPPRKDIDKKTINDGETSSSWSQKRHSIEVSCPSIIWSNGQQVTTGRGSAREHLLIRLRQEQFHQSRSSSMSLSLAEVELTDNHEEATGELQQSEVIPDQKDSKLAPSSTLLMRESRRLTSFRDRLESRRTCISNRGGAGSYQVTTRADQSESSQFRPRSRSSLSERISDKLIDLRHSCKHLLDRINHPERRSASSQQRAASEAPRGVEEVGCSIESSESRLRLTDLWVRDHCSKPSENKHQRVRGQSLDVDRRLTTKTSPKLFPNKSTAVKVDPKKASLIGTYNSPIEIGQSQDKSTQVVWQVEKTPGTTRTSSDYWSTCSGGWPTGTSDMAGLERPKVWTGDLQTRELLLNGNQDAYYLAVADTYLPQQQQQHHHHRPTGSMALGNFRPVPMLSTGANRTGQLVQRQQQLNQQQMKQANLQGFVHPELDYNDYNDNDEDDEEEQLQIRNSIAFQQQQQQQQQQQRLQQQVIVEDEDYAIPADETAGRLERSQVELVQMIGEGQKGFVFLSKLQSRDGSQMSDVAIKTLKFETPHLIERLLREAEVMRQLDHPHIIRFLGVCCESPALIAMELAEFGECRQYLKLNRHLLATSQLVLFAFQLSTALSYLESKRLVHRDVAARNVLVCSPNCVKLADFGLTRSLVMSGSIGYDYRAGNMTHLATIDDDDEDDEYSLANQMARSDNNTNLASSNNHSSASSRVHSPIFSGAPIRRTKLPVRWLAPESLAFRRFSSASDVWMFATCSWELFHFGQLRPWPQLRNNQVLAALEAGQRLPRPPTCPQRLYDELMLPCWSHDPNERPRFRDLKQSLWSVYLNERAREQMQRQQVRLNQQQQQQQHQIQHLNMSRRRQIMSPPPSQPITSTQQSHPVVSINRKYLQKNHNVQLLNTGNDKVVGSQANSASNLSSTSTSANETSSSRSSSMGSLARRKLLAAAALENGNSQRATQLEANSRLSQAISRNQSRFEGHPNNTARLQKQRSQGSMMDTTGEPPIGPVVTDDLALLERRRRHQALLSSATQDNQANNLKWAINERNFAFSGQQVARPKSYQYLPSTGSGMLVPPTSQLEMAEHHYDGLQEAAKTRRQPPTSQVSVASHWKSNYEHQATPKMVTKGEKNLSSKTDENQEEEVHRLALHRRLLGHIRPPSRLSDDTSNSKGHNRNSITSGDNRRSVNLSSRAESTTPKQTDCSMNRDKKIATKDSVDSSLAILESLISGTNNINHNKRLDKKGTKRQP